jgi:hypothetical protein
MQALANEHCFDMRMHTTIRRLPAL